MGSFRGVELDDLELAGDRLVLRRWRPEDADRVHAVMQDRSMREFLDLPDPYTADAAARFVTDLGHEGRGAGTGLGCAVVERDGGRVVGATALRLSGDPDIGYWVAPDARGRAYATEVTRVLANWGLGVLGLPRVRLDCDVANTASVRTAMAAGFRLEGVARDATTGRYRTGRADLAHFARLAGDPDRPLLPALAALPPRGLSDGVLRLRPLEPDDADAVYATEDSVAVGWSFTGAATSLADRRRACARTSFDWLVAGPARMAMVDEASGAFAGELTVRLSGPPQLGSLGYGVHPRFRGRGYTARALRLLVPWAFETAGLARLELGAKAANVASQRAAAAAGFRPDGVAGAGLRNPDGSFSDEVRFALVNPRYR